MLLLGVNIDHIATLRQARYRSAAATAGGSGVGEPDVAFAGHEAVLGGADILTVHLREDRRHIQDRDLDLLARLSPVRLNLEMGATDEMAAIARRLRADGGGANAGRPQMCTLVPEGRQEVTTEGGLDVAGQLARLKDVVASLKDVPGGMVVSAFVDASPRQIQASKDAGFDACEIHTGPFAAAFAAAGGDDRLGTLATERDKVLDAGHRARAMGMRFHAGHALNYANVGMIASLPGVSELHIGHAIVSRAVFTGLREAVREMKRALVRL
ncbi:MAG: pyridoxine 5'-phosphate synthase [Phycisphaerales bacterium]